MGDVRTLAFISLIFLKFVTGQTSNIATQLGQWNKNLINIIDGAQQLGPFQPFVQGVTSALEEFQEQLDVYEKYDWDFDHYLEEDVPAAVRGFFMGFFMHG